MAARGARTNPRLPTPVSRLSPRRGSRLEGASTFVECTGDGLQVTGHGVQATVNRNLQPATCNPALWEGLPAPIRWPRAERAPTLVSRPPSPDSAAAGGRGKMPLPQSWRHGRRVTGDGKDQTAAPEGHSTPRLPNPASRLSTNGRARSAHRPSPPDPRLPALSPAGGLGWKALPHSRGAQRRPRRLNGPPCACARGGARRAARRSSPGSAGAPAPAPRAPPSTGAARSARSRS